MATTLTDHGRDALDALIQKLPKGSVIVEVGRSGWDVTTTIAKAIKESGKSQHFSSIGEDADQELFRRLHNDETEDFVKLIANDPEDAAEEFGRESINFAFIHPGPQNWMIRLIWTWSELMDMNGLLCGVWDDRSRIAIQRETRGAYVRVGFDQSIWKIPLYNR